jgi:hypothetical protein
MFKLGEYYEDEAKPIVKCLKDAGIKAELRTYLCAVTESSDFIEGKFSDMRGEITKIEDYERYLDAVRATFAKGATPDNFKDMFFSELDPSWTDKREKLDKIFAEPAEDSSEECECCECCESQDEDQEEPELEDLAKLIVAFDFALTVISRNEIESGEDAQGRLEDPILRIRIDAQDYKGEKPVKQTISVELETISEIYVDEFSAPRFDELNDEFQESYPEEFLQLMGLGILIKDLVEDPSPGKIDMQTFLERLDLEMEREGEILTVDGTNTANEIARVLEKNDVIKHKGDTIKWKS